MALKLIYLVVRNLLAWARLSRQDATAVYRTTRRLLSALAVAERHDASKDAELLVLRHENAVLRSHVAQVRYTSADRLAEHRIRRRAILGGLIHEYRIAAVRPDPLGLHPFASSSHPYRIPEPHRVLWAGYCGPCPKAFHPVRLS